MKAAELTAIAAEVRKSAYAPYSNLQVGAALLTDEGQVFTGCNVENASYGLAICAERVAVFTAIAAGAKTFSAIAISMPSGGSPCGACRQVLNEFNPAMQVYLADQNGECISTSLLNDLLPQAFGPENLE
ncbi:MAG: cytidine deaminase [Verrucomicrobiae bacterium]|nr:cytidine deaminase [Verrucomicrobiae bacterium]NNJ86873.1 cytidine deaminase [Akkermansiaceae bacterium]